MLEKKWLGDELQDKRIRKNNQLECDDTVASMITPSSSLFLFHFFYFFYILFGWSESKRK